MCGIVGTTFQSNDQVGEIARHDSGRMTKIIRFRGPDHQATWTPTVQQGYDQPHPICMGASVLDISGQKIEQPWVNNNGALCFNGEIYDRPPGSGDTRWLAEQFRGNDYNFLRDIDWHGAIAYYDYESKHVTLVRDHFGAKPLYYMIDRRWGNLKFSSSMAAFPQKSISGNNVEEYEACGGFWFHNNTPYKGVFKMNPGEVLVWDCEKNCEVKRDNLWNGFKLERNEDWSIEEFKELCINSIEKVGRHPLEKVLMLSGGLDSSVIASVLRGDPKVTAVSSTFESDKVRSNITNQFPDDSKYMKRYDNQGHMASLTAALYELPIEYAKVKEDDLSTWSHIFMASHHYFFGDKHRQGTRTISFKKARDLDVKIVLTGDGADELFTGYNGDDVFIEKSKTWTKEWCQSRKRLQENMPVSCFGDDSALNRSFWKLLTFGEANCLMSDACAGMFGMEFRAPFLTQSLAKYCLNIPIEDRLVNRDPDKIKNGTYKRLLRDGFKEELPKHILETPTKTGWASPYDSRNDDINVKEKENYIDFLEYLAR